MLNTDIEASHGNYSMIPMDDIRPNPFQPRHIFNQDKLEELAQSITRSGIYQPLVLRKPISSVERYEIIAGERRFRASLLAGLKEVPAVIRNFSDEATMEAAIVENLQREDLSPLEEAEAYASLMQELNLTQNQVSERLGKSRPYIANYLRLLGLPVRVKEMLQKGALSMGQARTLLGLKDPKKLEKLATKTLTDGLTVRRLEEIVNQMNAKDKKKAKKVSHETAKSPFIKEIESQLQEKLGAKATVMYNAKQKGKIEINYDSVDELDRILEILNISLD
ncbi:ParB/RepB/Spo0J family partition protein [Pediococcus argentinicus]|uniref:ParB/RepB/Spo0J family partition protein n=1 Tax=Pediococcus argentinicus TaxID=480391 RepID=UPI003F497210